MNNEVIDSLVSRGDISKLTHEQRVAHYVGMCEHLGINPASNPFAVLKLNGKEVLYATRGATDQLASIHKLTREIIDGPKIIDLAGTKLVYAVCKATHPNGRTETAVATVPLVDPVNVLMKCETKAKRRATLSILGLGILDESELETIPQVETRSDRTLEPTVTREDVPEEPVPSDDAIKLACALEDVDVTRGVSAVDTIVRLWCDLGASLQNDPNAGKLWALAAVKYTASGGIEGTKGLRSLVIQRRSKSSEQLRKEYEES